MKLRSMIVALAMALSGLPACTSVCVECSGYGEDAYIEAGPEPLVGLYVRVNFEGPVQLERIIIKAIQVPCSPSEVLSEPASQGAELGLTAEVTVVDVFLTVPAGCYEVRAQPVGEHAELCESQVVLARVHAELDGESTLRMVCAPL